MKIILVGSMGRTGSSFFQAMLSYNFKLTNYQELPIDPRDGARAQTIKQLSTQDNWVIKCWIEDQIKFEYQQELDTLQPDIVINSYRENHWEQFLSYCISLYNEKWNSSEKMQFDPVEVDVALVDKYIRNKHLYRSHLDLFRQRFTVIDLSYEQLINDDFGDFPYPIPVTQKTIAKQNTFDEKIKLIKNYQELEQAWQQYRALDLTGI